VPQHPKRESLVSARAVAKLLGIKETTVYSLVKGVRGWSVIEPLPVRHIGRKLKRPRFRFSLDEVNAWAERTQFKRAGNVGRRPTTRPFPVGASMRYWLSNGSYLPVEVLGYTNTDRVRVGVKSTQEVKVVKQSSLSFQ